MTDKFTWKRDDVVILESVRKAENYAFCPTGEGGGVDNSCPPANAGDNWADKKWNNWVEKHVGNDRKKQELLEKWKRWLEIEAQWPGNKEDGLENLKKWFMKENGSMMLKYDEPPGPNWNEEGTDADRRRGEAVDRALERWDKEHPEQPPKHPIAENPKGALKPIDDPKLAEKARRFTRLHEEESHSGRAMETMEKVVENLKLGKKDLARVEKKWGSLGEFVQEVFDSWTGVPDDRLLSLQRAAAEEFGVSAGYQMGKNVPQSMRDAADNYYKEWGSAQRAVLREVYKLTQKEFAYSDLKQVTLYRGMRWKSEDIPAWAAKLKPGEQTSVSAVMLPMSSFSTSKRYAQRFSTGGVSADEPDDLKALKKGAGVLIATTVPVSNVILTSASGVGADAQGYGDEDDVEKEWVVLSSKGKVLARKTK